MLWPRLSVHECSAMKLIAGWKFLEVVILLLLLLILGQPESAWEPSPSRSVCRDSVLAGLQRPQKRLRHAGPCAITLRSALANSTMLSQCSRSNIATASSNGTMQLLSKTWQRRSAGLLITRISSPGLRRVVGCLLCCTMISLSHRFHWRTSWLRSIASCWPQDRHLVLSITCALVSGKIHRFSRKDLSEQEPVLLLYENSRAMLSI